jgi:hypothetical protein
MAAIGLLVTMQGAGAEDDCHATGGTVPGSPATVYVIDAGAATVYIDDSDMLDLDGDGVSQGLSVYLESNGTPGLQPGGSGVVSQILGTGEPADPCSSPDPDTKIL